jgi:hypothetical protein
LPVYLQTTLQFDDDGSTLNATIFHTEWFYSNSYCERVHVHAPVAQPANAYSNLAFVVSGAHMLLVGLNDCTLKSCAMSHHPIASLATGAVHVFAGCASFAFHASLSNLADKLDMLGVFLLVLTPTAYFALCVAGWPTDRTGRALLHGAAGLLVWALVEANEIANLVLVYLLCGLLGAALLVWAWPRRKALAHQWAAAAAALVSLAFGARAADFDGSLCHPASAFQWHAVWHALAAGSLWCLWGFQRSE